MTLAADDPNTDVRLHAVTRRASRFGRQTAIYIATKRLVDIVVAGLLLLATAPLFVVIYVLVRATSRGPGLFWSHRVGFKGALFLMPKFRSMHVGSDLVQRERLEESARLMTPIGRFLRRSSLDELPQLWSVLVGDMSLVGPRPLLAEDDAQATRAAFGYQNSLRPGMTGLAQINGRNRLGARPKARYDAFYQSRVCAWLDLRILARTVGVVWRGDDVM